MSGQTDTLHFQCNPSTLLSLFFHCGFKQMQSNPIRREWEQRRRGAGNSNFVQLVPAATSPHLNEPLDNPQKYDPRDGERQSLHFSSCSQRSFNRPLTSFCGGHHGGTQMSQLGQKEWHMQFFFFSMVSIMWIANFYGQLNRQIKDCYFGYLCSTPLIMTFNKCLQQTNMTGIYRVHFEVFLSEMYFFFLLVFVLVPDGQQLTSVCESTVFQITACEVMEKLIGCTSTSGQTIHQNIYVISPWSPIAIVELNGFFFVFLAHWGKKQAFWKISTCVLLFKEKKVSDFRLIKRSKNTVFVYFLNTIFHAFLKWKASLNWCWMGLVE